MIVSSLVLVASRLCNSACARPLCFNVGSFRYVRVGLWDVSGFVCGRAFFYFLHRKHLGARCVGLCLLWCGVVDVMQLLSLCEQLLGHFLPSSVLVLRLLYVVGVVGVLSFCCGGLKGHFGPLRVVLVLGIFVISEFFFTADVVSFSLIR